MRKLQWRSSQKACLKQHNIPSAEFMPIRKMADLKEAEKKLGSPFVLKKCFGGYDGHGTFILGKGKKKDVATLEKIFHSCSTNQSKNPESSESSVSSVSSMPPIPFIAERKVLFKRGVGFSNG